MLVRKLLFFTALFVIVFSHELGAELKLDNWKTYTTLVEPRDVTIDDEGLLWVGTTGGVYTYSFETKEINEFRNTEGLLSLKISAIAFNPYNKSLYIGTSDGFIHILNKDKQWNYITDIVVAKYPNPEVKKFIFNEDFAIITGGFGVAKFDTKKQVFLETVQRFDYMVSNPVINDILISDNKIWIATESGIATIALDKQIANPKDWKLYDKNHGLADDNIRYLYEYEGLIYAASETQISRLEGTFSVVQTAHSGQEVRALFDYNDKLLYSSIYEIFDINNIHQGAKSYWQRIYAVKKINYKGTDIPVILYNNFSISYLYDNENIHVLPNSPMSNVFADMDVDSKGRLWIATRLKDQMNGRGFSMLDNDGKWHNFVPVHNNIIKDQCLKIKVDLNDDIYVSTWGGGYLKVTEKDTGFNVQYFDTTNSPFTGAISTSRNYVIAGETKIDKFGQKWVINYGEGNPGPVLISIDKDGNYSSYPNYSALTDRQFLELETDQWGTKWLASSKFGKGIYYFNENGTPDNPDDDEYGRITQSNPSTDNELLENDQSALAIDKTGILWIGTASGLNLIYDTYSAVSGQKIVIRKENHLLNQFIYDLHIDALNNKWVATNNGVWVLNDDASETLNAEILNSSNSPLIDNQVISLFSNPENGLVYFGTKNGLSVAQSSSVIATEKYDINCYPQPFNPVTHKEMYIDGLEENSNITITGADGTFVKSLNAKGRIVNWDGRDFNGNLVASGVYIVIGSSATTKGGAVGKFAVLRK